ncbi:MAG TPA: protein phosphatase 2C domain-containing protein [Bacillaceae bacterium]
MGGKNEDGLLVLNDPEKRWELAMILDAHCSSESACLVIETVKKQLYQVANIMNGSIFHMFKRLEDTFLSMFLDETFIKQCQRIKGETSCLVCIRIDGFLWWFSIGDCLLFLLHEDFRPFGQAQLNQRNFFEWIGKESTFHHSIPCYSTGTRELRKGQNEILLLTDGFLDGNKTVFSEVEKIYGTFYRQNKAMAIQHSLEELQKQHVKDSSTIIVWECDNGREGILPSV